jgi:valyl-tRNA synthetase
MNEKYTKPYNHLDVEPLVYSEWEKSGYFNPDNLPSRHSEPYSIVLPPPNVTGTLHMGHATMLAIEDILIRYKRMKGFKTLWLPGTDHAAIATQSKVEKDLIKKEGKSRHDLGREEFLNRVNKFAQESHDTIANQVRKMGSSVDWSREAFTLDEKRNLAVRTAFKEMYDLGLIYRGNRIINWDPKGQTTISDDEIVYVEEKTKFYYFKYGPFTIGTSRPETKFGDKYVVMHPDDKRYAEYKHGDKIELEWINGPITSTVIKDDSIDMEFGTGVMTITPWHSMVDFDIAKRHGLDCEQVIDKYGKLLPIAGEFAGIKISQVREKMLEKIKAKGLLVKEEDYEHNVATAERTGGIIEPQVMLQWFISVNKKFIKNGKERTLKEMMVSVVENKEINILPDRFEKTYFSWINNLRDWCISRQIWYGHRIPVWYKGEEVFVGVDAPKGEGWTQDEDTLDTWFSSGIWTFSTLGWPEETADLKMYHPTNVLETGYDIIFFWVARMILMTGCLLDTVPFRNVYLHGLVRTAKGEKMSKSKPETNIDPLDMIEKYGADATRLSVIIGNAAGNDLKLSEDKIRGYKHFANKLWNITRFVLTSAEGEVIEKGFDKWSENDLKLNEEVNKMIAEITGDIDNFRLYLAAEKLYHYAWHRFADEILEESKKVLKEGSPEEIKSRKQFLLQTLSTLLRVLHPFIPYVTEEIWKDMPVSDKKMIMIEEWPV